ncbi:MAG: hypothetical protein ACK4M0_14795 [Phreatobacter sp.]
MSYIVETILSEPRLMLLLVISIAIGIATGATLGFMAGLWGFGISFVALGTLMMVRAWSRRR